MSTHICLALMAIAYVLPDIDALTHVVIRVPRRSFFERLFFRVLLFIFLARTYFTSFLKVYYRSVFIESSKVVF